MNKSTMIKPADHIKALQAKENAKVITDDTAKQPVDAAVEPVAAKAVDTPKAKSKIDTIIDTKRKSDKDWEYILAYKAKEGLKTDKELAEVFKVSVTNIHQKRAKFKADSLVAEEAKLSTNTLVDDAKKLLAGIDEELKAFDAEIEVAKAKVDNAKDERAKIEAKTVKFQAIIDMLGDTVEEKTTEEAKK